MLLKQAERQPQYNAGNGSYQRNHIAFHHEDVRDEPVACSEIAQGFHIVALVDDEHGQRADYIEAGYQQDECQEKVGDKFFYLHDAECVGLLFVAVLNAELVSQMFF